MADRLEDLDAAFTLPDNVEDPALRQLYEVLVARMRAEARHLPMNTVQQLLIERIAFNYIVLRAKENNQLGGFAHSTVQKDYNTFWLSMTSEFNRLLGKVEPLSAADKKGFLREIQAIIVRTLDTVDDPKVRSGLFEKLAAAFQEAGI